MNDNERQYQTVKVVIHGHQYPIKASSDDGEYIRRVAKYVDEVMEKVASESRVKSVDRLAILTALNITDELFNALEKRDKLIQTIEAKAKKISDSLSTSSQDE